MEGFIGIGVVLEAAAGGAIVPRRVILGLVPLAAGVVIDCLLLDTHLPGALDELEVLAGGVGEGVVEGAGGEEGGEGVGAVALGNRKVDEKGEE